MALPSAAEFEAVYWRISNGFRMTAGECEDAYGRLIRAEYPEHTRERGLSKVLVAREPPICIAEGVLRVWLKNYKMGDVVIVSNIAALEEEYGDVVKELAKHNRTPYQLRKALSITKNICIAEGIAKEWLQKNGRMKNQRTFGPSGILPPHVRGVRTYFGILY